MLEHFKVFAKKRHELRGDEAFLTVINQGIENAKLLGFTKRGAVRLYLEMMFSYGWRFETDPQFSWLNDRLSKATDKCQIERQNIIYNNIFNYAIEVYGVDNFHAIRAINNISKELYGRNNDFLFNKDIYELLVRCWPEKLKYMSSKEIEGIEKKSVSHCQNYNISPSTGRTIFSIIMISFGHGVFDDSLYPWVYNTLRSTSPHDGDIRLNLLYNKSIVYMNATLDNLKGS